MLFEEIKVKFTAPYRFEKWKFLISIRGIKTHKNVLDVLHLKSPKMKNLIS